MLHVQRVFLNEPAARFYDIAHQLGEQVVGFGNVVDLDLQQGAGVGVERGFNLILRFWPKHFYINQKIKMFQKNSSKSSCEVEESNTCSCTNLR